MRRRVTGLPRDGRDARQQTVAEEGADLDRAEHTRREMGLASGKSAIFQPLWLIELASNNGAEARA